MEAYEDRYWRCRLESCQKSLEKNNFKTYIAAHCAEAGDIFRQKIFPELKIESFSWGDSMTLHATGIIDMLKKERGIEVVETFASDVPRSELLERRRKALLVDLFLTGSNAVTDSGKLVNLDMVGNRVGGITFGPRHVVLLIGRNKIVRDVDEAMRRVKNIAAPLNAMRHEGFKTPCMKTSFCTDCKSPDRICNTWTITEKSYPKHRVKVILINQDLGL